MANYTFSDIEKMDTHEIKEGLNTAVGGYNDLIYSYEKHAAKYSKMKVFLKELREGNLYPQMYQSQQIKINELLK